MLVKALRHTVEERERISQENNHTLQYQQEVLDNLTEMVAKCNDLCYFEQNNTSEVKENVSYIYELIEGQRKSFENVSSLIEDLQQRVVQLERLQSK